jgi:dipeptidyl aminopeptidase/acylaminoacyl peptidase
MERGSETDVMVVAINPDGSFKGQAKNLTGEWDLRPRSIHWTSDGKAVRFGAGIGGNAHVFEVSIQGGKVRQITRGDRRLSSVSTSKDGTLMAYSATDAVTPTELYISKGDGSLEHKASSFNDSWMADIELVPPERLTWKVKSGAEIEGWLVKPLGYQAGKKYPLVLKIHGGPHGAYGNTFFRTFHVLSAAGFFVLYPNPRGSSGYGHEFMYATRGQWGEMDQEDYLGGVDAVLAKYADIDPGRVGVSGGSYGGYMTNWLTATTDRFAAAVTSRSITNWESWWGSSDAQGLTEYEFFGAPWEQRELYRRLSPISYVENVSAPTLIIHSENDYRTPIADGEQWFMSLKKRGVPVELVRYPRSSHGLSRTGEPWLLVDRLERLKSWFVHWLIENPQEKSTDSN